ncbi:AraC family transcriptional regulator [Paenibacillus arenilitoris]|uniref:Helix-turn-helix transcriptional regulator n=1 Tax=Paenibacillus arenilitoris TaxID=2772299 RepID=A0A927CNS9_9BACL|nr:AraC family transcriptional regulator [Paenibacillus arenilitoris]MBD2869993.1 helix-turn-helix transcriptional regulator [Paenibacillus arenilitoris]
MSEQAVSDWPVVHNVGDIIMQAGFVLGPRTINDYELVYFPDGSGTIYEVEGMPYLLDEPCFVFTRPGEWHAYRFAPEKNVRHMFVHFEYASLREGSERFEPLLSGGNRFLAEHYALVAGMMQKLLWIANRQPPHWARRLAALLSASLEELSIAPEPSGGDEARPLPVQVQRAVEYMEEHLSGPLTIEEIAARSGWTHEHFTRVFSQSLGMTPKRMLLERRLRRAELLMMRGAGSLKQIAYSVGFGDEHHFSKMYKRIRGITASEYIKRCNDPLFRHTAAAMDARAHYPVNRYIPVQT